MGQTGFSHTDDADQIHQQVTSTHYGANVGGPKGTATKGATDAEYGPGGTKNNIPQPSAPAQPASATYSGTDILQPGRNDSNAGLHTGGQPSVVAPAMHGMGASHMKDPGWDNTVKAQMGKSFGSSGMTRPEAEAEADLQKGTTGGYHNKAYDGAGGEIKIDQDINDQTSSQRRATAERLQASRPKTGIR